MLYGKHNVKRMKTITTQYFDTLIILLFYLEIIFMFIMIMWV